MKLKIELDITPDEAQDLLIPSSKQKEFAMAVYEAYVAALSQAVTGAMEKTVGKFLSKNPLVQKRNKPQSD